MGHKNRFQFRAFVSLLTGFSFIIVALSGIVLYISPKGRIANWTNWTFWNLSKQQWAAIHICFTAVFVLLCLIHVWLNIRPLINYFRRKVEGGVKFRYEWPVAALICAAIFWGSLNPFAPFSTLLKLREELKINQELPKTRPPVPHAEILTIAELADQADLDIETALNNLKTHNIVASVTNIFGDIASQQNLSPEELYAIFIGKAPATSGSGHGGGGHGRGGFGQKTLRQLCQEMDIPLPQAIEALKTSGIDCSTDQRIRNIADDNNIRPSQIRGVLENLPTKE